MHDNASKFIEIVCTCINMHGPQWKMGNLQKFIGVYEKRIVVVGYCVAILIYIHIYIYPYCFASQDTFLSANNLGKILVNPRQTDGYMLTLGVSASVS